jgi:cytochrome c553
LEQGGRQERAKQHRIAIVTAVPYAQPTERAPDTMEARLLACAACHGRQGEGTKNDYFPHLGKPAGYLMNQLVAFRDGRRRYPPMNYLLEYLPDPYLQKMADYFAALRPPPVPRAVAEVSTQGWRAGVRS